MQIRKLIHHLLFTFIATLPAVVSLSAHAAATPLRGAQIAVAYLKPNSGTVYGQNFDQYYHPASTQKVITALAALLQLGPDYTFHTALKTDAPSLKPDASGNFSGRIVIEFSGDPTLTNDHLSRLIATIAKAGIRRLSGQVILDVSRYGGLSRGEGGSWNDLPACFTAPASPIIISRNCTFAELQTHGYGAPVTPVVSQGIPIKVTADAVGINPTQYGRSCALETRLYADNHYHISGCVPVIAKKPKWPLSLAVTDPISYGKAWIERLLRQHKIACDQPIRIEHEPFRATGTEVAAIDSKPMRELVRYMLLHSNNLYADTIAKTVGYEFYHDTATYAKAASAIRAILKQKAGIDLEEAYMVDGCGLSAHNLITAHQMLNVLTYIRDHDSSLHFIELLPKAGRTGTLSFRASVVKAPLKNNVSAKTGTMTNVSNLAGFLTTQSGHLVPFVIFENGMTHVPSVRQDIRNRTRSSPHYRYERYVLEQIYAEKTMGQDF